MKILGIVTSYYPDLNELKHNINSYINGLDALIIWENTPKEYSQIQTIKEYLNNEKITVWTTGKNEYIAKPFNIAIAWAEEKGFTHLLTMDQDSYFQENDFLRFCSLIEKNKDDKIAIFAPSINYGDKNIEGFVETKSAITSGSIHNTELFKTIGNYEEELPIHMGDVDFCIRIIKSGFRVVYSPSIILKHKLGYNRKTKWGFIINPYPAQSTYYIVRNNIVLWKKYPELFPLNTRYYFIKYRIIYRVSKLFFEEDALRKLKAIVLGIIHGIRNRTGEYSI